MTIKILAFTDTLGNLVRFRLMPGNRYDSVELHPLIDGLAFRRADRRRSLSSYIAGGSGLM